MKKIFTLAIVLTLSLSLTACKKAPVGEPQAILNKAWEKLADKNASYQMGEMTVSGKGSIEMEQNKANLTGSGTVEFDSRDEKNMKSAISLDITANGELEGKKANIALKGKMRVLEKKMYLFLENLNIDAGDPQTNMMANLIGNLYKSQWIALPSSETTPAEPVSLENFRGKKMAELAKKHYFFEVKEDLGGGKYEVVINVQKLKAYLREVGELNDTPLTAEDLASVDNLFQTIKYTLQVQIDNEYNLTWVKGNLKAEDPMDDQQMNITFEGNMDSNKSRGSIELTLTGTTPGKAKVEFNVAHKEKTVSIQTPENAQNFDLGSLLGGGLGGGFNEGGAEEDFEAMMGLPQ